MRYSPAAWILLLLAIPFAQFRVSAADAPSPTSKPAPLLDRVAAAAPDKPTAAPAKPRKLVIFTYPPTSGL